VSLTHEVALEREPTGAGPTALFRPSKLTRRHADTSLGHFVALFSVPCVRVDARSLSLDADDVVS
jgi:hypothetical protein